MISIVANGIHKRYQKDWILKDFTYSFGASSKTGISGRNGSGKSTLLRILSGFLTQSKGDLNYFSQETLVKEELWYKHFSYFGPNIHLNEELFPIEIFNYVKKIKPSIIDDEKEFIRLVQLEEHKKKQIKSYSSGMKQRLALGLTILSKAQVLFLDEPSSFLDKEAKVWFQGLLEKYSSEKTVVIASNDMEDFKICEEIINI